MDSSSCFEHTGWTVAYRSHVTWLPINYCNFYVAFVSTFPLWLDGCGRPFDWSQVVDKFDSMENHLIDQVSVPQLGTRISTMPCVSNEIRTVDVVVAQSHTLIYDFHPTSNVNQSIHWSSILNINRGIHCTHKHEHTWVPRPRLVISTVYIIVYENECVFS